MDRSGKYPYRSLPYYDKLHCFGTIMYTRKTINQFDYVMPITTGYCFSKLGKLEEAIGQILTSLNKDLRSKP